MTELQTERLLLRPFIASDLDEVAPLMANPQFMRFSSGVYSRARAAEFLAKVQRWNREGAPSQFAAILRTENKLIGYCGFFPQTIDAVAEIEIGYRLHPDYWQRGLSTEGARAVRDHAFEKLNLPRVISLIHPDNTASRRVAEKNGMTLEKTTNFRGSPTYVFAIDEARFNRLKADGA